MSAERERYRVDDLTLDVAAVTVRRDDRAIELPKLSFDLLVALVRRSPDVVSVDELTANVWPDAVVSDETVVQRVALLRRALGDDAREPRYVRSVRGRGYQLVPEAERLGVRAKTTEPATQTPEITKPRRRRWTLAWVVGGVTVAAHVLFLVLTLASDRPAKEGPAATERPVTRRPGVHEQIARADAYLASQRAADNELALELYERALASDPQNVRALVGASLATSYRTTRFNQPGSEADHAEILARRALAVDPESAGAHKALALAHDARSRVTRALEAYQRAVELDPDDAAAASSTAYLLSVNGRLADALALHVRLLDVGDDVSPYLDVQIAENLALLGFDEPARVWFERAVDLRPESVFAATGHARWLFAHGRLDEADRVAAAAIERGIERPELFVVRGDRAWRSGDLARARVFYAEAEALDPTASRPTVRRLVLDADESAYRTRVESQREGRALGDEWPIGAVDEAILHAGFGRDAEAGRALDVAIDLGFRDPDALRADPVLGPLAQRAPELVEPRIERLRALVEIERQRVLSADWLPPSLLSVSGSAASSR